MKEDGKYYDTMPISIDRLNLNRQTNGDIVETRRNRPRLALYCGVVLILCSSVAIIMLAANTEEIRKFMRTNADEKDDAITHSRSAYHSLKKGLNNRNTHGAVGCEGTVLIMRHCEGAAHSNGHCNFLGFERANYIASLFGASQEERWPLPSYLYATRKERLGLEHNVYREIDTLLPLSSKSGMPIISETLGETGISLAAKIHTNLLSGEMCGKLAVISWKHDYIPLLAENLGCGPLDGCPMYYDDTDFDTVWQLKFFYDSRDCSNDITEGRQESPLKPEWVVYASLLREDFDPLHWSKLSGDYPMGGKATGGNWRKITN